MCRHKNNLKPHLHGNAPAAEYTGRQTVETFNRRVIENVWKVTLCRLSNLITKLMVELLHCDCCPGNGCEILLIWNNEGGDDIPHEKPQLWSIKVWRMELLVRHCQKLFPKYKPTTLIYIWKYIFLLLVVKEWHPLYGYLVTCWMRTRSQCTEMSPFHTKRTRLR